MVRSNLESLDFRFSFYHHRIATSILQFGIWITKGATNWQSAWQNPNRPHNKLILLWLWLASGIYFYALIHDLLSSSCLINLAPSFYNSFVFINIWWFVISTQRCDMLATFTAQNSAWITDIGCITNFSNNKDDNSAAAWSFNDGHCSSLLVNSLTEFNKSLLCFCKSLLNSFFWSPWKLVFLDYIVMKIIT